MGLILAGILAGIFFICIAFLCACRKRNFNNIFTMVLFLMAIVCIAFGCDWGISAPISGYEDAQLISSIDLVSLRKSLASEDVDGLAYIYISGTNSYTYHVEIDSSCVTNTQKSYESSTIFSNNVTIVEDDNYTDAKLFTYVRNGKKSFWTFALGVKQYEYVFYVPTGTIVREVS